MAASGTGKLDVVDDGVGGAEARSPWEIPLADVRVDDELVAAATAVVRSGWWSMGPTVASFESAFAGATGAEHALAVSSGTAALHLALLAAGCGPGDEVIVPSLAFVAAANVVVDVGATPVFCDVVGENDLTMSPDDVAAAVTPATKAIIVLHYGGHPCAMGPLLELAEERGLVLVEDAAHAAGATWDGRACGTIGRVGCFSFFANKNLATGEGGMLVTDDAGVAERVALLRSHGMTSLTWERHHGHASSYDVVAAGFNYRMSELAAAIGLVQLGRLEAGNAARARIVARYRSALHGANGLAVAFPAPAAGSAHHLAVLVLPRGADRGAVRESLRAAGIQTSVHYPPIHRFTAYRRHDARPLPQTEDLAERLVTLPLFPHLDDDSVERVVDAVLDATRASA